ncbi:MAG: four helix bundle protein [Bacteroidales bacterium]|nr:four helix bundle protein [Bacteroidales bacterium]MBN2819115.1 four helix bundle protein [Bacteroidales bacterium]
MNNNNVILRKSYKFALQVVNLYKLLCNDKKEYVLSKQLLRSGTSIGANINEAMEGVSKADFVNKLSISLKEARETLYWLNLLKDSEYLDLKNFQNAASECDEIIKILKSIIITTKEKYLTKT